MADFMNNMINRLSDGTQEGDLGVIPPNWHSEGVYNVQYIPNESMTLDPSTFDSEFVYLSEIQENCRKSGCKAILLDGTSTWKKGYVSSSGEYTLI